MITNGFTKYGEFESNGYYRIGFILLGAVSILAFYIRGYSTPIPYIPTTSYLIPILTTFCLVYVFLSPSLNQKILVTAVEGKLLFSLILLLVISIIYNLLNLGTTLPITQFSIEIFLNLLLLVCIYLIAGDINTQDILDLLLFAGVLFSIVVLYIALFQVGEVRRIGNTELPISVNHLSSSLVVSFAIGICKIYFRETNQLINIGMVSVIFIAIFLTGSRSGFLSLGVVIGIFVLAYGWDFITNSVGVVVGIVTSFIISLIMFSFTSGGGLGRISPTALSSALFGRFERYIDILQITLSEPSFVIFGSGMDNYTVVSVDIIIADPHNLWLSFALFFGLPAAFIFFLLHLSILTRGVRFMTSRSHTNQGETITALVLALIVVSIYVSFSGRITRIYTIWIVMGLVWEQYTSRSSLPPDTIIKLDDSQ